MWSENKEKHLNEIAGMYLEQGIFNGGEDYDYIYDKIYITENPANRHVSFFPFQDLFSVPIVQLAKKNARRKAFITCLIILAVVAVAVLLGMVEYILSPVAAVVIVGVYLFIYTVIWFRIRGERRVKEFSKLLRQSTDEILESFSQKTAVLPDGLYDEDTAWKHYMTQWLYGKIMDTRGIRLHKIFLLDLLQDQMSYGWNFETDDLIVDEYHPKLIRYLLNVRMLRPEKLGVVSLAYLIRHAPLFAEHFPAEAYDPQQLLQDTDAFTRKAVDFILTSNIDPQNNIPAQNVAVSESFDKKMDYVFYTIVCKEDLARIETDGVHLYSSKMMQKYHVFLQQIRSGAVYG